MILNNVFSFMFKPPYKSLFCTCVHKSSIIFFFNMIWDESMIGCAHKECHALFYLTHRNLRKYRKHLKTVSHYNFLMNTLPRLYGIQIFNEKTNILNFDVLNHCNDEKFQEFNNGHIPWIFWLRTFLKQVLGFLFSE